MLSLIATSIGCAAVCVRAGIACISVGMLGLCRTFFICADGKKTAFVCALRTFVITAAAKMGNGLFGCKSSQTLVFSH